jgi:hypothetical protein
MPRRNRPRKRQHVPPEFKGKGLKRPRYYHSGAQRDEHFAEADRLIREAEARAREEAA